MIADRARGYGGWTLETTAATQMTDAETKPFGGYGVAIRTFWMKGRDLAVFRGWSQRESLDDPNTDRRFSTTITGKAVSEDSVCDRPIPSNDAGHDRGARQRGACVA
jgi:hypothetical protein